MLIFEELSISDDVKSESNTIKQTLYNTLSSANIENVLLDMDNYAIVKSNEFLVPNDSILKDVINVIRYKIIYFQNKELYSKYFWKYDFGGEFNIETNTINMILFGIGDEVNEKYLNNVLFHEVHHAYQLALYKGASGKLNDLYKISLAILNDNFPNPIERDLSKMIYFLDQREIDANMQALYQELKLSQKTDVNNILMQFNEIKGIYDTMLEYMHDDNVREICYNRFNITLDKLMTYLSKRISYFENKKRKVFAKIKMEETKLTRINARFQKYFI